MGQLLIEVCQNYHRTIKMKMPQKKKNQSKAMDKEYEIRRQKNNDAVRKSREKAREKAQTVSKRIDFLKSENEKLEEKKKLLRKELSMLKEMFLAYNHNGTDSNHQGNNGMELAKLLLRTNN